MTTKLKDRPLENKIILTGSAAAVLAFIPILLYSIQIQDTVEIILSLIGMMAILIIFLGVLFTNKTKTFSYLLAVSAQIIILVAVELRGENLIYWAFPLIIACFYLLPTIVASILNAALILSLIHI